MPKLKANDDIITKNKNYDKICKLLYNACYYSNDEIIEIALEEFGHDFRSHRQMYYALDSLGVKKNALKYETVRIDSTFRFMDMVEKLENRKENKKKNEKQIQEKLDRLKAMEAKSEDSEQY